MGQAKQRGSFDDRRKEAIIRDDKYAIEQIEKRRKEEASLTPAERERRKRLRSDARMLLAMAASLGAPLP